MEPSSIEDLIDSYNSEEHLDNWKLIENTTKYLNCKWTIPARTLVAMITTTNIIKKAKLKYFIWVSEKAFYTSGREAFYLSFIIYCSFHHEEAGIFKIFSFNLEIVNNMRQVSILSLYDSLQPPGVGLKNKWHQGSHFFNSKGCF